MCQVSADPISNQQPTPSQLNISINNRRMRTFYVAILCACMVGRCLCSMVALFHNLLFGGRCEEKREEDGRVHHLGNFRNRFQNSDFFQFSPNVQASKFCFFSRFPAIFRGPKNSQNADFSAVSWDFEVQACPKILRGFPAMNRAQNLDLPTVSRDF